MRIHAAFALVATITAVAAHATAPELPIAPRATPAAAAAPQPVVQAAPPVAAAAPAPILWTARESDGSVLNVLLGWAPKAGWTFRSEHWTVLNDYPIQGSAVFGSDFRAAVRALLETTANSGAPVQPCFYSNSVLRVIAGTDSCDRGATHAAAQANAPAPAPAANPSNTAAR